MGSKKLSLNFLWHTFLRARRYCIDVAVGMCHTQYLIVSEANTSSRENHQEISHVRKGYTFFCLTTALCCSIATALVTEGSLVSARFRNTLKFEQPSTQYQRTQLFLVFMSYERSNKKLTLFLSCGFSRKRLGLNSRASGPNLAGSIWTRSWWQSSLSPFFIYEVEGAVVKQ